MAWNLNPQEDFQLGLNLQIDNGNDNAVSDNENGDNVVVDVADDDEDDVYNAADADESDTDSPYYVSESECYDEPEADYQYSSSSCDEEPKLKQLQQNNPNQTELEKAQQASLIKRYLQKKKFPARGLPRIFPIPPKLYCKTSRSTSYVSEDQVNEELCSICHNPTNNFYSECQPLCFEDRGRTGENILGPYLYCSFRRRNLNKR